MNIHPSRSSERFYLSELLSDGRWGVAGAAQLCWESQGCDSSRYSNDGTQTHQGAKNSTSHTPLPSRLSRFSGVRVTTSLLASYSVALASCNVAVQATTQSKERVIIVSKDFGMHFRRARWVPSRVRGEESQNTLVCSRHTAARQAGWFVIASRGQSF